MFVCSHQSVFFEYFGVPHRVELDAIPTELSLTHPGRLWAWHWWKAPDGRDRRIAWPRARARAGAPLHYLNDIPFFAELVVDDLFREWRGQVGRGWKPLAPITNARGKTVGTVWQDDAGTTLLPFDPDAALGNAWAERYRKSGPKLGRGARQLARSALGKVRPLVPLALRGAGPAFPRWPNEPALHDLSHWLLDRLAEAAGEPVPYLAPWPNGCRWAFVLASEVDGPRAARQVEPLRLALETAGCHAAWFFAPGPNGAVDDGMAALLRKTGHEVGLYGLKHDGQDLDPRRLAQRLPLMRRVAIRLGAIGFRARPGDRDAAVLARLGFDYDSSYPDTTPDGQGGCGAWLPFFNGRQVELPLTLPDDRALFGRLRGRDERLWLEKAAWLRDRGGLALLTVHPDHLAARGRTAVLERFLWTVRDDPTAWRALPRELSDWWRRRAASRIVRDGRRWRVAGPAAGQATIRVAAPTTQPTALSA